MAFEPRTDWEDLPSTDTPVTAADLIRIENGIKEASDDADEAKTDLGSLKTSVGSLTAISTADADPAADEAPTAAEFDAVVDLLNETKAKLNSVIAALKA